MDEYNEECVDELAAKGNCWKYELVRYITKASPNVYVYAAVLHDQGDHVSYLILRKSGEEVARISGAADLILESASRGYALTLRHTDILELPPSWKNVEGEYREITPAIPEEPVWIFSPEDQLNMADDFARGRTSKYVGKKVAVRTEWLARISYDDDFVFHMFTVAMQHPTRGDYVSFVGKSLRNGPSFSVRKGVLVLVEGVIEGTREEVVTRYGRRSGSATTTERRLVPVIRITNIQNPH
jgi:hypothetical protein